MRPRISIDRSNRSLCRPEQPRAQAPALSLASPNPASPNLRVPSLGSPVQESRRPVSAAALLAGSLRPAPASRRSLADCRAHRRRRGFSWRSLLGSARALQRPRPFFPACGVLMSPHGRGIQHNPVEVRLSKSLEDRLPAPLFRPAVEALVHRVVLAEALWEVWPRRSSARDPEHRVQKAAVIVGVASGYRRRCDRGPKACLKAAAGGDCIARRSVHSVVA